MIKRILLIIGLCLVLGGCCNCGKYKIVPYKTYQVINERTTTTEFIRLPCKIQEAEELIIKHK